MTVEDIARVAHEANRAYCEALGDTSQVAWHHAPKWQKDSVIVGVLNILNGGTTTPEESHESWLFVKRRDGWVYGPEKDAEKKTHPCMVPYEQLPEFQKVKDRLFFAVVAALSEV